MLPEWVVKCTEEVPAAMQICKFCFLVLFTQSVILAEEDDDVTVAEEIGEHQLARLAEMLMPYECEEFLEALAESKEKISARSNIVKRDTSSSKESEAECRKKLKDILRKNKMEAYYDRLTWALRHINRVDITLELGKNINQDKILNLKRYAEGYHDLVKSVHFQEAEPETGQPKRLKRASDLTQRDLDLIVERRPMPESSKGPLDVALPLLYGILLGFMGTFLAAVSALYLVLCISRQSQKRRPPRVSCLPIHEIMIEN
ncbi:transmembrane and death domain protein 1 isoform 2-T2 [Syngnathus typhle]